MKQVLSQQEINKILDAVYDEDGNSELIRNEDMRSKVKPHDFRRPIKLSKEYINTLHMIFENYASIASNILSNQLRIDINLTLGAIDQISFDEFNHSIPNPSLIGIFHSPPLSGNQMIEINPQLGIQLIELLCGGGQLTDKRFIKKEKFTDIEIGIVENLIISLIKGLKPAWSEILDIEPEFDEMETNPSLIQLSPNEPVVLISCIVEIPEFENYKSLINICIPYVSFENFIDKLSTKSWFNTGTSKIYDASQYKEQIIDRLENVEVDVTVELGRTLITVDEFLNLDVGDIIQLDMRIDKPMKMYVEDKARFLVQPGIYNGNLAVQVLEYAEEDVEI